MNWPRRRLAAVFYFLVAAPVTLVVLSALPRHAAPQTPASEIVLGVDPSQSKVHWTFGSTFHKIASNIYMACRSFDSAAVRFIGGRRI